MSSLGAEVVPTCGEWPGGWARPVLLRLSGSLSLCPGVEGLSLDVSSLVDIRDYVNKELALRIHTDIDSQGTFFTDLNGFQVIPGAQGRGDPSEQNLDWVLPLSLALGVLCSDGEERIRRENQGRLQTGDPFGVQVEGADALDRLALPDRCSPGGI